MIPSAAPWKHDGVRVIPGHQLDPNAAQTPGMNREAKTGRKREDWSATFRSLQPR